MALLATAPVAAHARMPKGARLEPQTEAVRQVDGISSQIVDNVWSATDHYWHKGDYNRIIALVRVCVEAEPDFTEAWEDAAWLLWSQGDTAAADALLKDAVARNPKNWDLYHELGWHLFRTKRYAQALPYLKRATEMPDTPSMPWKALAHCYDKMGRLDDSIRIWKIVVMRYPKDGVGPINLARVQAKQKLGAQKTTKQPNDAL